MHSVPEGISTTKKKIWSASFIPHKNGKARAAAERDLSQRYSTNHPVVRHVLLFKVYGSKLPKKQKQKVEQRQNKLTYEVMDHATIKTGTYISSPEHQLRVYSLDATLL